LRQIAGLCSELKIDGHRGELTIMRAARALAAFEGRKKTGEEDVERVATMALRHRLRRDPLEEGESGRRIEQAIEKVLGQAAEKTTRNEAKWFTPSEQQLDASPKNGADSLPAQDLDISVDPGQTRTRSQFKSSTSSRSSRRDANGASRGRYAKATLQREGAARVAVDATLRSAAHAGYRLAGPFPFSSLRFKHLTHKSGTLFIIAIDTSGSMAQQRINQAKAAALSILRRSYVERDDVAIISFRDRSAEIVLPPSRSMLRAKRALDTLSVGGGTPLTMGLLCSLELTRKVTASESVVLLFTDGHANVSLRKEAVDRFTRRRLIENEVARIGFEFKKAKARVVVVETNNRFKSNGGAQWVADRLGSELIHVK
jgi:magnesium chelatase subunit D